MKYIKTIKILLIVLVLSGCKTVTKSNTRHSLFRAGEDSFKFSIAISNDERRGETPLRRLQDIK